MLAYSAPHELYQETIGIVIVTRVNKPAVDLITLCKYLENKLHRSKWPQIIIYMNSLPKNATGKILRIKFAERIGLTAINDEMSPINRLYEAICPKQGTALTVPIEIKPIIIDITIIEKFLCQQSGIMKSRVIQVDLPGMN